MTLRMPAAILSLMVVLLFVLSLPGIADARGGRGGGGRGGGGRGGGFSRSSPARGGGFSSRSVSQRPAQASRPSGMQQRQPQAATRPAQPSTRQAPAAQRPVQPSTRPAGPAQRPEQPSTRPERPAQKPERPQDGGDRQQDWQDQRDQAREDWQQQQNQNREDWQDWAEDEHWDDHWHHDDDFYAGVVVGTAVGVAAAQPTYVTVLPCTTTAVIVNGVTYYNCSGTWYSRGYSGGSVVYVVTAAP